MIRMIAFVILLSTCFVQLTAWTYAGREGPQEWPQHYPSCGARQQSPINIDSDNTLCHIYPPFVFKHYDKVRMASFLENGHTAVLSLPEDLPPELWPSVRGGGLRGEYIFKQLHFHWGPNDDIGSEHVIDDDPYAGEMHLVHFNAKYGTYENALNHSDGLAVLGIFLEVIDLPLLPLFALFALPSPRVPYIFQQLVPNQWSRSVYFKPMNVDNRGLRPILRHLGEVTHKSDWVHIPETVDFHELLPASTRKFYRYHGSLTTPPCSEIITWTLFQDPITISSEQLAKFRRLRNEEDKLLINNDRPPQPINERIIHASFDFEFPDCIPFPDFGD